jgi:uncharacterized RDD family membrane protein YckC
MSRSKRRRGSRRQGELVDLPLAPPAAAPPDAPATSAESGNLPLFPDLGGSGDEPGDELSAAPLEAEGEPETDDQGDASAATDDGGVGEPRRATGSRRLLAAVADFVVHLSVLAGGVTAMALLGLEPRLADVPGLVVFVLSFSFLYTVVSLAFWGQTPGMAWAGIKATDRSRRPLTFGQTALRWTAAVLGALLAGLPLVLCFTRRSFADLLSGSESWQDLEPEGPAGRG